MNVRALIVDDELHAREGIRIRLKEYSQIKIIGEYSSGEAAIKAIEELRPDLVFLDIQMPGMSGFEVLSKVSVEPMPIVIFVTAFDKYAVKAFEFHALDYLLKPIEEERFRATMKIAVSQLSRRNIETYADNLRKAVNDYINHSGDDRGENTRAAVGSGADYIDRLAIKTREHISMLPVAEIDWIESAGDYVYVHSNSQKYIIKQTLASLESRIDPKKFVRIHRSAIVNVDKITSLRSNDHGDYEVNLKSGERLKLSRSFRAHFQEVIGNSF